MYQLDLPPCSVPSGTCPFDYIDNDSWKTTSPKIGFTYNASEKLNNVWLLDKGL